MSTSRQEVPVAQRLQHQQQRHVDGDRYRDVPVASSNPADYSRVRTTNSAHHQLTHQLPSVGNENGGGAGSGQNHLRAGDGVALGSRRGGGGGGERQQPPALDQHHQHLQHHPQQQQRTSRHLPSTGHESYEGSSYAGASLSNKSTSLSAPAVVSALRELDSRPSATQVKDMPVRTAEDSWSTPQVAKVYTAGQFEHPAKMARLPLSQWEKSNATLSVRFQTSLEPQHRPRHYQEGATRARRASAVDRVPRTRHSSADDRYDRLTYKKSVNDRSTSSSPGSYGDQRVGHNMRAVARTRGPPAGRHRQDLLDRMMEQHAEFCTQEQYRQAARDVVNSILLADSGASATAEQQAQRDMAFRLLDEAFPLAQQGQGAVGRGKQRQGPGLRSASAHSGSSSCSDASLPGGRDVRRREDRETAQGVLQASGGHQASHERTGSGTSALWQQSLSAGEHELLVEALRHELGLLNNGAGHR